jgi:hypothetical protein
LWLQGLQHDCPVFSALAGREPVRRGLTPRAKAACRPASARFRHRSGRPRPGPGNTAGDRIHCNRTRPARPPQGTVHYTSRHSPRRRRRHCRWRRSRTHSGHEPQSRGGRSCRVQHRSNRYGHSTSRRCRSRVSRSDSVPRSLWCRHTARLDRPGHRSPIVTRSRLGCSTAGRRYCQDTHAAWPPGRHTCPAVRFFRRGSRWHRSRSGPTSRHRDTVAAHSDMSAPLYAWQHASWPS